MVLHQRTKSSCMLLTDALKSFNAAKPCFTSSEFFNSSLNSAELGSSTSENVLPQKLVVVGAAIAGAMGLAHKRNANMPDMQNNNTERIGLSR